MPLAAIDILEILQNALQTLGYPAVFLFIMIESSGIPFPGETKPTRQQRTSKE
jgi:membrane protein DedA with SNARE-associated domain